MAIKVGDRLPNGTLNEFIEVEREGCTVGPNTKWKIWSKKKIAIFGCRALYANLPGQACRLCEQFHALGAGVDEIWCISVNDALVRGAGEDQG
jgi:peroxiredoxin